jgi:hypothetical protein
MKKTITLITLALGFFSSRAQSFTADFESFSLPANSAYSSTVSTPFQTTNAIFEYKWDTQFSYWAGGFAYTNKYDSSTAGSGNLYGVKAYKGYNNSNTYVVAQDFGVIKTKAPYYRIDGFYITNTTYAYKSMKNGDQFAKKFGGPSGNDPDFFKVTVKAYAGGVMKSDSVVFMLADYTFTNNAQDYIVNTWQYVNTSVLGYADSLQFFMYSSDVGQFGINTPLYFAIDNVGSTVIAGLKEYASGSVSQVYPNPFQSQLNIRLKDAASDAKVMISDISGRLVYSAALTEQNVLNLEELQKGIYFVEVISGGNRETRKFVKE